MGELRLIGRDVIAILDQLPGAMPTLAVGMFCNCQCQGMPT